MNRTKVVTTVVLNEANDWMAEVTDLPLYEGDRLIEYTWQEETVTGYTLTSTESLGNLTILTNTHEPELVSTTVTKVWDDNDNGAHARPAILRVHLSNGNDYYLSEKNNWTVTVNNLPKYRNGELITYTWSEQTVAGYTLTDVTIQGNATIFTNTYSVPTPPGPLPTTEIIDEYGTPLGVEVIINHVGDCFD
jgi:hypothetical protein